MLFVSLFLSALSGEIQGWGLLSFICWVSKCYTCPWLGGTDTSAFLWTWFSLWSMFSRCFLVFVDMEESNKSILFCTAFSDWSPTNPLLQYVGGYIYTVYWGFNVSVATGTFKASANVFNQMELSLSVWSKIFIPGIVVWNWEGISSTGPLWMSRLDRLSSERRTASA